MLPDLLLNLSLSDVLLFLCVLPASWFWASYGLGSPWWRVKQHGWLGVVTFMHATAVMLLLVLIVYGITFGQKVDEPYRVSISSLLLFALISKVVILHYERRQGRLERLHTGPIKEIPHDRQDA
jgi:hypothetical protein